MKLVDDLGATVAESPHALQLINDLCSMKYRELTRKSEEI